MVAEDHGDVIAQDTARQLVLYHRRGGGQSQFPSLLELQTPTGRFSALLSWAREHLDQPLTVEILAEASGPQFSPLRGVFTCRDRIDTVEEPSKSCGSKRRVSGFCPRGS